MRFILPASFLAGALSLMLIGCDPKGATVTPSPTPTPVVAEDPDVEGCEHLGEGGQKQAITASSPTATESVPTVNLPHVRYDVSLVASGSQRVGKVVFNSGEAADYLYFLSQDVPFQVKDAEGKTVEIEASATGSAKCDIVKGRHLVELGVGGYALHFGPTSLASVSMVIEEAAH